MLASLLHRHQTVFSLGVKISKRCLPISATYLNQETTSVCTPQSSYRQGNNHHKYNSSRKTAAWLAFAGSSLVSLKLWTSVAECEVGQENGEDEAKSLKLFSRKEVAERKTKETGVWVIYGKNVYDITEFIDGHPGGRDKIVLAAGGNLEPFWDLYAIHKKQEVLDILSEYHIGQLVPEDWVVEEKKEGPYANDPKRHPALLINSSTPFNAETPPALAVESLITSNELFYVRNHLPVPDLDEKESYLVVEGLGLNKPLVLSVEDLKTKFEHHKVVCAIQCAGNRRNEMTKIKPVKGLGWSSNAISNAEWTGVYLRDVLVHAGVDPTAIKHIHFEGADIGPTGAPYGASIPSNRVFKKDLPVLIAFEMNGEPIPRDHGYPLRLVAPGIVGARNVKWLNKLIVSDEEYSGHWQQKDYKSFSPNIDWHNVGPMWSKSLSIQELPVTSAICSPQEGANFHVDDEEILVKGYAFSGGGNGIIRVDVSVDGGATWHTADLTQAEQEIDAMYSWTLWECVVPIEDNCGSKLEILCRATDATCNTQPEGVGAVWNLRGCLNNSWHRINVNIEEDS